MKTLPANQEMMQAFMAGDHAYDGVFITGVRTTGIFCRPSCTARKPKPHNVEFFDSARAALFAGYRPCKRCRPLEPPGQSPRWVRELVSRVQQQPERRWRDRDLRAQGIEPSRARRWFKAHHGMTFHAFARGIRLGSALGAIRTGKPVTDTAMDHDFDSLSGFNDAVQRFTGASASRAGDVISFRRVDTPLGPMVAGAAEEGLCFLEFADRRALEAQLRTLHRRLGRPMTPAAHPTLDRIDRQLEEYFAGERRHFDLPLVIRGTAFQEAVWRALMEIPCGETRSYQELAAVVGRPGATRAVGTANGANRLAIVIPCHRVIGADGKLAGYGGGLWRKQRLLELERNPG